jgi:TRAP-type C4-dicarboxylate transport system permease small subunit
MRKLRALEDVLIRVESALAVVLVLTMLLLAAYNVVYRNVLVPLQQHWAHSGPPVEPAPAQAVSIPAHVEKDEKVEKVEKDEKGEKGDAKAETKAVDSAREGGADDFAGFGGGLGDEADADEDEAEPTKAVPVPVAKAEPAKAAGDDFGGFGGGLDAKADEPAPAVKAPEKVAVAEPAKAAGDDFAGFGGGLGDDEDEDEAKAGKAAGDDFAGFGGGLGDDGGEAEAGDAKAVSDAKAPEAEAPVADEDLEDDDEGEDDLGDDDQFANLAEIDAVAKKSDDSLPQGGPPPAGSFAAWAVELVDDLKLDWIDIFLRQLVIIVAFFGAMLATQRGKHINVDALSKSLPPGVRRVVGVVLPLAAVGVCLVLARAGWDLVSIGREYPKDLLPSVPEWSLQLMFPVGFGLLAVHFLVRLVEAAVAPPEPDPPPRSATPRTAEADVADDDDDDDDDEGGAAPQKGGR